VFRWEKRGAWWYGVLAGTAIKIKQIANRLIFQTSPEKKDGEVIKNYFRIDDDLPDILSRINRDEHIQRAIQRFYGLRLCRQEPWECLISFICATYKNIPAIKQMIRSLCERFGREKRGEDHTFYTFPTPSDLAHARPEELRRCRLGFRAERIIKTAAILHRGRFALDELRRTTYEESREKLLSLPGVGYKVADCVLLFSLDKLDAFPVDTRIKRSILRFYPNHFERSFVERVSKKPSLTPKEYRTLNAFGREYYGEWAGYAQEYLFNLATG
jgi:N-glycosylase/DNA lyase